MKWHMPCAAEVPYWLAGIVYGSVQAMFDSYLQSQGCVWTPEFFWAARNT